jgi:hypothetical protein
MLMNRLHALRAMVELDLVDRAAKAGFSSPPNGAGRAAGCSD